MTYAELKAEAYRQGYRLQKIPEFQCSCFVPYPNESHKCKNGKWKCVDKYEPMEYKRRSAFDPCTHCRLKEVDHE